MRTVVYWITTVAARSWPSSVLRAGEPSIRPAVARTGKIRPTVPER